jgi:hypothetical protein
LTTGRDSGIEWRELIAGLVSLLRKDSSLVVGARLDETVQPTQWFGAVEHLAIVLQLGTSETLPICASVDRIHGKLQWRQNPNYADAAFLDGYAYCELVGPHGHLPHPDIALGLLLLGPHVTYAEHAHPAAEIYAVVAGRAEWLQGDRIWRGRAPGDAIHHASMEPHAMRTTDEPLLAAYLWQDHLADGARLVSASSS